MRITNQHNLPAPILRAITRDDYTKGAASFSVTELIDSPRARALRVKHDHEIERDASDFLWSLMGRALHRVLQDAGEGEDGHIVERRFFATIKGIKISGGVDLIEDKLALITDYKMTGVANVQKPKREWEIQLNLYNYLCVLNGFPPADGLQICAILRDWKKAKAKSMPGSYPQAPIVMVQLPMWHLNYAKEYLEERVEAHMSARIASTFDGDLPLCSDEDRWVKPSSFAVMHPKKKRAVKLFDNRLDADEYAAKLGEDHYVFERVGSPLRCIDYCEAAPFCSQWQTEKHLYTEVEDDE